MQYRAPLAALEDRYAKVGTEIERNERMLGALEGARVELQREREQLAAQLDTERPTPLFAQLKIASPCPADWDKMTGDERVRFCGECKKNVYNVSEMTRHEAEELLRKNGDGDMCVRFYERADGTILTQDCPVGVKKKQRRKLALAVIGGTAMWGASIAAASSLMSSLIRGDDAELPQAQTQTQVLPPIVPGHLKVNGESGSNVSVDNELAAILPAATFTLRPGKHTVRVTHPDGTGLEVHEIFVTPGMLIEINQRARIPVPVVLPPDGRHVAGGIRRAPLPPIKGINTGDDRF